jgi:hypothetical protein
LGPPTELGGLVADLLYKAIVLRAAEHRFHLLVVAKRDTAKGSLVVQLMVLQHDPLQAANAHQAGELTVLDEFRGERVGDEDLVPVLAGVGVLDQDFDFVRAEPPPVSGRLGVLLVPQVVFRRAARTLALPPRPARLKSLDLLS